MYRIHRAVHWASLDAYIRSLAPAAWFRQGVGITVTGSGVSQWDDQSGNGRHLLQATDAARPIDLPFSGTRYLYLPGVAGNYASTPDSVANSITGDIDIRVRVALDDWTPTANKALVGKYASLATGSSYYLRVEITSGVLTLVTSPDGTNASSVLGSSTASPTVSNKAAIWVRATLDVNDGSGNRVYRFYTAADSVTEPTSWTQLGTTVTTAGATSIADTNAIVECGTVVAGATYPLDGTIYRAIIKNGIDGTTVVDFNPADAADSAASFASSTTGETWTINRNGSLPAQIVGRSSVLFNGTSHYLKTAAFTLNQPEWVLWVGKQVSWTNGDYVFDGHLSSSSVLFQAPASPTLRLFAGAYPGTNSDLAVGSVGVVSAVFNGASSSLRVNSGSAVTGNSGAQNMGGLTLGARGDGAIFWGNISTSELIVFPFAPAAEQELRIIRGLMARHGVA